MQESVEHQDTCAACPPVSKAFSSPPAPLATSGAVKREPCSWFEVQYLIKEIARQLKQTGKRFDCVLGISTGGIIPAKLLAVELGIDNIQLIPARNKRVDESQMPKLDRNLRYVVVDDIYDSGGTCTSVSTALKDYNFELVFCMARYDKDGVVSGRVLNHDRWIVFPWEQG